jgi:hypothetical protein
MEDTRLIDRDMESRRSDTRSVHEGRGTRGRFGAFGVAWDLESEDPSLYRALVERLPPGTAPCAAKAPERSYSLRTVLPTLSQVGPSYLLLADGRPLVRTSEAGDAADALEDSLKWLVAERSPRRVFLRAGVVGWRDRAIVIAGGPGTGKRTLVRALVARGATYFSDDYAVLDGNLVEPFPSRHHPGGPPKHGLTPWLEELAPARAPRPVPVGVVLFAPYRPGAVFKPKLVARGRALLEMFKHAVAAQRNPTQVLRALEMVSRRCNALEGARGDARAVATYLLDRLV